MKIIEILEQQKQQHTYIMNTSICFKRKISKLPCFKLAVAMLLGIALPAFSQAITWRDFDTFTVNLGSLFASNTVIPNSPSYLTFAIPGYGSMQIQSVNGSTMTDSSGFLVDPGESFSMQFIGAIPISDFSDLIVGNLGGVWGRSPSTSMLTFTNTGTEIVYPYQFDVHLASPIPEPSAAICLSLSGVSLLLRRRRF